MESIKGVKVRGKKVIVRVDYNVPMKDGKILDDKRIVASLETLNYLIENKAKIILLSHLGRVKEEADKEKNSLFEVAKKLSTLVKTPSINVLVLDITSSITLTSSSTKYPA